MKEQNQNTVLFQSQIREKAAIEGKNPETFFVLEHQDYIDVSGILEVLANDGAAEVVKCLDGFIFEYLRTLCTSNEREYSASTDYKIWTLRRLRDAIVYGIPNGLPLGDSDYKHKPFKM